MLQANELFSSLTSSQLHSLQADEGSFIEIDISNIGGSVTAFADGDGSLGLFIPFGSKDPKFIAPDVKSPNITLKTVVWRGKPVAQLRLEDRSFVSVFHAFVDQFIRAVYSKSESAVLLVASQLRRWRSLFTPAVTTLLSAAEELGLICELTTLKELVDSDGDLAFYRWTGPSDQKHDFRLPDRSIECKATQVAKGLTVSINGADQLTAEPEQTLLLNVRKYEASPNGAVSLPDLVAHLASDPRIPGDSFLEVLRNKGFSLNKDSIVNANRFHELENHVFEIGQYFPRMTSTGLEKRITSVSYSLDLTDPEKIPGYRKDKSLKL